MNNLDWLCENDREALAALIAAVDGCEHCIYDSEADCGVRCDEGVRVWLEAEHNDGSALENGASADGVDSNDGKLDIDSREKLEADIHEFKRRHAQDKLELIAFESIACRWLDRQAAITERECAERIRQLEAEFAECDEWRIEYRRQRDAEVALRRGAETVCDILRDRCVELSAKLLAMESYNRGHAEDIDRFSD